MGALASSLLLMKQSKMKNPQYSQIETLPCKVGWRFEVEGKRGGIDEKIQKKGDCEMRRSAKFFFT